MNRYRNNDEFAIPASEKENSGCGGGIKINRTSNNNINNNNMVAGSGGVGVSVVVERNRRRGEGLMQSVVKAASICNKILLENCGLCTVYCDKQVQYEENSSSAYNKDSWIQQQYEVLTSYCCCIQESLL